MRKPGDQLLKNKVAVVTGGSRGIGKAIAFALARNGANVLIAARSPDELSKTSEMIRGEGGSCHFVAVDISNEHQVNMLFNETFQKFGHADILVNNAGVGIYKSVISTSLNDWEKVIDTNLKGAFLCSKVFIPSMIRQRNGHIVNIISGAGKVGMKNLAVYCSSKFGLLGLTLALKKEVKEYGIDVSYLCPGYVKTAFFRDFPPDFSLPSKIASPSEIAQKVLDKIVRRERIKRLGSIFAKANVL